MDWPSLPETFLRCCFYQTIVLVILLRLQVIEDVIFHNSQFFRLLHVVVRMRNYKPPHLGKLIDTMQAPCL